MKTASRTDVGKIRLVNEDRALVKENLNGYTLAIVADGMGGHRAGDTASECAIQTIGSDMERIEKDMDDEALEALLHSAIVHANRTIYDMSLHDPELAGMGTTVVTVVADGSKWMIAHIGDSRAYKVCNHQIEQLTEDHSLVNELLKRGQITSEEATHHPRKNVLTRALGTDPQVTADIYSGSWKADDVILICSDGLTGLVSDEDIVDIISRDVSLDEKVELLVQKALEAGGDDNITAVLLWNDHTGASTEEGRET